MLSGNLIIGTALIYVTLLFGLAWFVDRRARSGGDAWIRSPIIYTLSLSVYCTAWTFYGAVGSAARNGLEFITIYLGPTLVFVGWWWFLHKVTLIGRTHRITSIADMISSRFGKSKVIAVVATLAAVIAATPYIALQLQSLTLSYSVVTGSGEGLDVNVALWISVGMAAFTILFGTRALDENERHYGVVAAIAVEAVVKLTALISIGLFAIFGVLGGVTELIDNAATELPNLHEISGPRWVTLLVLSGAAIICLPRQFHVAVVENSSERQLRTASWLFPLYLFMISVFVLPIAVAGLSFFPEGSNPDLFVLTLPLTTNHDALAVFAFIGGFSSATSMVIVATIALSTMVSNHIVAPLSMRLLARIGVARSGDVLNVLLYTRRISIVLILALGFIYFRLSGGSNALASIGLIAFCGVAQFLPSLAAGVLWRGATRMGALCGILSGFALWGYTLFLPSFEGGFVLSRETIENGLFGIAALRPQGLLGVENVDPLVHATAWSLGVNILVLILVSLFSRQSLLEQLQGALFVNVFKSEPGKAMELVHRSAASEDLFQLAQRILGRDSAHALFDKAARAQGKVDGLPDATPVFISQLERELAGSVGAASAHAMVSQSAGGETIPLDSLMEIADEAARLMRTSQALELKSLEAERTAEQLRAANDRLRMLDSQKDEFLSQVSHELRTPMASIRSFAETLESVDELDSGTRKRFASIIQSESIRLTRLLDDILDLKFLEEESQTIPLYPVDPEVILDKAAEVVSGSAGDRKLQIVSNDRCGTARIRANRDRLSQIFINLMSNAIQHNDKDVAHVFIRSWTDDDTYYVEIADDGPGVPEKLRERVFEKMVRGEHSRGAGLGLAISYQILLSFGGEIELMDYDSPSACFQIRIPLEKSEEEQAA
ncbi:MAG: sensor histidine kinase [Alphaproteobacteria bacterium]